MSDPVAASRPRRSVWRQVLHHPSAILLASQLLVVLSYPSLEGSTPGRAFAGVFQMVAVLAAVWAVRHTQALTWVAVTLGLPAMGLAVAEAMLPDNTAVVLVSALLHVPFYLYVSWAMMRYLFHDGHVTRDELFATGAAFTVVAWAFAYLYAAVQVLWPESFVGAGSPDAVDPISWFDLLYLSFTTLTSVGLSDVYPISGHARSIAMVEQVVGVFYVALVVSRLVGLTVLRPR